MYPINEIGMNTNQTYITEKYRVPYISTFYQITNLIPIFTTFALHEGFYW